MCLRVSDLSADPVRLFMTSPPQSLAKLLQVEDLRHNRAKHAKRAIGIVTILIAAVVAVVLATLEALAKVAVVVVLGHVVAARLLRNRCQTAADPISLLQILLSLLQVSGQSLGESALRHEEDLYILSLKARIISTE